MTTHTGISSRSLATRRLGSAHIVFFVVAASAPLTAVAGGIPTTYATTGSTGVPLSFVLIALVLVIFAAGYAAMSRYVANAGAFYSYVANGLGRTAGVGASFVAVVAYNAMQIGLYGLFGFAVADLVKSKTGVAMPWWVYALLGMAVIGTLGVLRVDVNAKVLAVALTLESAVILVFDADALIHPAAGAVTASTFAPGALFNGAVGAVFAFGVAAFVGFESAATYSEEARDPRHTVARATYIAVALTGVLYALSSWAMALATGPDKVVDEARAQGPALLFGLSAARLGPVFTDVANVLFVTSLFAALLSFHNAVARYFFALGREGVLPAGLATTGQRSGAPVAGSATQTTLALVVVTVFAVTGRDPVNHLFIWLTNLGAVGVVLLMATASLAVFAFFRSRGSRETLWQRTIAPVLAAFLLFAIFGLTVRHFGLLIGPGQPAALRWALPALLGVAALVGVAWGAILRARDPNRYARIGRTVDGSGQTEAVPAI